MLSRVADSVYWLSRYVERAENVARFIEITYNLTLGESETLGEQWAPLVYTTGDHETFTKRYGPMTRDNVLTFLLFDKENSNSIFSCVATARENARTIREILPSVIWEQLNKFYFMVRSAAGFRATIQQPQEFCERVRLASHLFVGAALTTMSQDEAWQFMRIGHSIERADKTSRIVDVQYYVLLPNPSDVGSALDVVRWSALLRSASALAMYRRLYGKIVPEKVAEFLILDRLFPRSMHCCVMTAQESLRKITGSEPGTFKNSAEQRLGRLRSEMDYTSIRDVVQRGLHEFIDEFQSQLNLVGEAIAEDFFRPHKAKQSQMQSQSSLLQRQSMKQ